MIVTADKPTSPLDGLGNRARLILQVALPRLARRSGELAAAVAEFDPDHATDFARRVVLLPGAEGLSLLSRLTDEQREAALDELNADQASHRRLAETIRKLGYTDDARSPAAALVQLAPDAAELDGDTEADSTVDPRQPSAVAPESPEPSEFDLAEAMARLTVQALSGDETPQTLAATRQLLDIGRRFGTGLPAEFWRWLTDSLAKSSQTEFLVCGRDAAVILGQHGDIQLAMGVLENVAQRLQAAGAVGEAGYATVGLAHFLLQRGELDRAEAILRTSLTTLTHEDRARAMTLGWIANMLSARGELDEAMRIHQDEILPIVERLGDVMGKAVTLGRIADVLSARGELVEALRIRREEELPVYERLGDVRARAVTLGGIADVLYRRGELDEALRIRREEELPVYERLGDVHSTLMCKWQIAGYLQQRDKPGDAEESQRLLRQALAAAEKMRIPEAEHIRRRLTDFAAPDDADDPDDKPS